MQHCSYLGCPLEKNEEFPYAGSSFYPVKIKASREIIRLDIRAYLDPAPNP